MVRRLVFLVALGLVAASVAQAAEEGGPWQPCGELPTGGPAARAASAPADPAKQSLRVKNLTRRLDYAKTLIEQNQVRRAKLMLHDIATNHGDTEPGREAATLLETLT